MLLSTAVDQKKLNFKVEFDCEIIDRLRFSSGGGQ